MSKNSFKITIFLLLIALAYSLRNVPDQNLRGVNLPPLETRSNIQVFVNLMRQASIFRPYNSTDQGKTWKAMPLEQGPPVDVSGYPLYMQNGTSIQSMTVEIGVSDNSFRGKLLENGSYILTWEGDGDFNIEGDGEISSKEDHKLYIKVTTKEKLIIRLTRTNPDNYVKNIKLFRAKDVGLIFLNAVFTNEFLKSLKEFPIIRACSWLHEYNGNDFVRTQDDLRPTDFYTQSWEYGTRSPGVSLYYLRKLVSDLNTLKNKTDTGLWVCLPSKGSEQLYKHIIQDLSQLPKTAKLFISYGDADSLNSESNQALQLRIIKQLVNENYGISNNLQNVYIVGTINSPKEWTHFGNEFNWDFDSIDVLAISGLFGKELGWDVPYPNRAIFEYKKEALLLEVQQSIFNTEIELNRLLRKASIYNLNVIAYGGGPFFRAPTNGYRYRKRMGARDTTTEMYNSKEADFAQNVADMNRGPEMKDLILDYLRRWKVVGGGAFISTTLSFATDIETEGYIALSESLTESSSKLAGFIAEINGEKSSLPYTSADLTPVQPKPCTCKNAMQGSCDETGKCFCHRGYSGETCNVKETGDKNISPNKCTNATGINIDPISESQSDWSFINIFKTSSPWFVQDFNSNAVRELDYKAIENLREDGYPKKLASNEIYGTIMGKDLDGHTLTGWYTLLFDGDGVLTFGNDVVSTKRYTGKIQLNIDRSVNQKSGILVLLEWTNPEDPLRNIRVLRPGFENSYQYFPFHPFWTSYLERFNVFRTAKWQNINNNLWTPNLGNARTFNTNGVSFEYIIKLANSIGVSPWISIPYQADDDYITNLANTFKNQLREDLSVFVEYADEVWSSNKAGKYAEQKGLELKLSEIPLDAKLIFYAQRSKFSFDAFSKVFDRNRLKFIISSKTDDKFVTSKILQSGVVTDSVAVGLQFIVPLNSTFDYSNTDVVNNLFEKEIPESINKYVNSLKPHIEAAILFKASFISYAINIVSSVENHPFFPKVLADTRFQNLYKDFLYSLKSAGVDFIVQGAYVQKNNPSALLSYQDSNSSNSYVYQGVRNFIKNTSLCAEPVYNCEKNNNCGGLNGFCIDNNLCQCFFGREDVNCSKSTKVPIKDCNFDCNNQANINNTCSINNTDEYNSYYTCKCTEGFYGPYCLFSVCDKNCSYNGKCENYQQCNCYPGFNGTFCEEDCNCKGHGRCDPKDSKKCICDEDYEWDDGECKPKCRCPNPYQKCLDPRTCSCPYKCVENQGVCSKGSCRCFNGFSGPDCSVALNNIDKTSKIGISLANLDKYSTQTPLVDLMKLAEPFENSFANSFKPAKGGNYPLKLELNNEGYPKKLAFGQAAKTRLVDKFDLSLNKGDYVLTYEGDGFVDLIFDLGMIKSERKGRIEFSIFNPSDNQDNGIQLFIYGSDSDKEIKNVKFFKKEDEFESNWNPLFLSRVQGFAAIKYTHWQKTHNSTVKEWDHISDDQELFTIAGNNGINSKKLVELINTLGSDSWINIPHEADDDLVKDFAKYLRKNVRKDVRLFIEFSYEIWNPASTQNIYANSQAIKKEYNNSIEWYAKRTEDIFEIIANEFDGSDRSRVVLVLTAQTGNKQMLENLLNYTKNASFADAIGLAAYFTCNNLGSESNSNTALYQSLDVIMKRCQDGLFEDIGQVKKSQEIIKAVNKSIVLYEVGPRLVEYSIKNKGISDPEVAKRFREINRYPQLKDVYNKFLNLLKENEFLLNYPIFHHNGIEYGSEGLLEYLNQDPSKAPKYQALGSLYFDLTGKPIYRPGCIDNQAINFDKYASENDNTCEYPWATITQQTGKLELNGIQFYFKNTSINANRTLKINFQQVPFWLNAYAPVYRIKPAKTMFDDYVNVCISNQMTIKSLGLWFSDNEGEWVLATNSSVNLYNKTTCGFIDRLGMVAVWDIENPPKNVTMSYGEKIEILGLLFTVFALILLN